MTPFYYSFYISMEVWPDLWPLFLTPALLTSLLFLLSRKASQNENQSRGTMLELATIILSFALLGMIIGFMGGLSREPAMNAIISSVLTLIGGLFIYIISSEKSNNRGFVAICVIALSVNLLLGAMLGGARRVKAESATKSETKEVSQKKQNLDGHCLQMCR